MSEKAFDCDDLRTYATSIFRRSSCCMIRGGFAGDFNDCSTQYTSHSNQVDIDTNTKNYLRMHMSWVTGNASTLEFTGVDNTSESAINAPNVKICGIAEPTNDNDLASKKYVDEKLATYFNVNQSAKALVSAKLRMPGGATDYTAAVGGLTFTCEADGPFSNPVAGGVGVGSVDVDGITLAVGADLDSDERLLIVNASGGPHAGYNTSSMNGVFILTVVTGTVLSFSRSNDLNTIAVSPDNTGVQKGDYVLVSNAAATHNGIGFFLNSEPSVFSDVDTANADQYWVQFAAHTVGTFLAPLHDDAGTVSLRGDTGGADHNKVLQGGAGPNGVAEFLYRMGRATTDFKIAGTGNSIGEVADSDTVVSVITGELKLPDKTATVNGNPLSGGTTNITIDAGTSLTLDGTGHDNNLFHENCTVASVSTGSVPQVTIPTGVATFSRATVLADMGAVNIQTHNFDQAVTSIETGSGILLDAVTVDGAYTNDNTGRFYLAAYKIAGVSVEECRFSIFNFNDSGGPNPNKANPLITFT